jgi:hypothetical protein
VDRSQDRNVKAERRRKTDGHANVPNGVAFLEDFERKHAFHVTSEYYRCYTGFSFERGGTGESS